MFPAAHVIGTDLSPIQPEFVPPNLEFQIADCESDWTFNQKFDFIHMRNLSGAIKDWPLLLDQALNQLQPGGWIEVVDGDVSFESNNNALPHDGAVVQWCTKLFEASCLAGRELRQGRRKKRQLLDAGFINVQQVVYKVRYTQRPHLYFGLIDIATSVAMDEGPT